MSEPSTLRAYADDSDTVIAHDVDDVRRWYVVEQRMIDYSDFDAAEWLEVPGEKLHSILWEAGDWEDLHPKPAEVVIDFDPERPGLVMATAQISAWIVACGRGLLSSVNW